MKVQDLIDQLNALKDGGVSDFEVYIDVDGKLLPLETLRMGQFYKSVNLSARVDFDIIRAEQTLLSALQFQPEELKGVVLARIERAIGTERVAEITKAFNEFKEKELKEQEENKDLIEKIQEDINRQEIFTEEEEKPVKVKKAKKSKKNSLVDAESILTRFYSGNKSDGIEAVKEAKKLVGEERANEIFKEVRNK